jgi:hypothetical protein
MGLDRLGNRWGKADRRKSRGLMFSSHTLVAGSLWISVAGAFSGEVGTGSPQEKCDEVS